MRSTLNDPPSGGAAIAEAMALSRAGAVDRARRLTESSFVSGSNALVHARTVLRGIQDCRERLEEASRSEPEHMKDDPSSQAVAHAFESLLTDLEWLTACARRLRPLVDGDSTAPAPAPSSILSPLPAALRHRLAGDGALLTGLKLRGLAAELEHGLSGIAAEVRVLRRAGLSRPRLNGRSASAPPADAPWERVLRRLEAQVGELTEQVAGFTRDAEQLSRELDQLR
jgi:hypothetical protein